MAWPNAKYLCLTLAMAMFFALGPARPGAASPSICEDAAHFASGQTGVPVKVLQALSLTETGRLRNGRFEPWPWTVNMEGKGEWFDTEHEAIAFASRRHSGGAKSFDVGCFQLNYRWHGQAFASIEQMFDPRKNAVYAARFLADLYREKGNWEDAAGAYHSRTPANADRYKERFARILGRLPGDQTRLAARNSLQTGDPGAFPGQAAVTRQNQFPLLFGLADTCSNFGSLFPLSAGRANAPIIDGG